jgi:two-component system NtrC family sensor kinase
VPVLDRNRNVVGVLMGGILLNRNFEIVKKITEVIHENEIYKGQEIGTVTIFQDDFRIATNVKNEDGSYAISTLVSEEIYDAVILNGEHWVGDAFVVNNWYISAYEPIRDIDNRIVGIMFVGILSRLGSSQIHFNIFGIAIGNLIIIIVAILLTRKISTPIKKT